MKSYIFMRRPAKICMLFLMAALFFFACTSRVDRTALQLNQLLDSLKVQLAHDTRIALWNLSVQKEDGKLLLDGEVADRDAYEAIRTSVERQFPGVENSVLLLPVDGGGQFINGVANNAVIHLRREPSSKKEMVTQSLLGTPVRILKEENGKRLIQVPDGYLGWVNTPEVYFVNQDELARYRDAEKIIYISQYGQSYSEPDETSLPVSDLVIGCLLQVVTWQQEFVQVSYPDGRLAWVLRSDVRPAEEIFNKTISKEGVVETVLRFHGIPYMWGGNSSKAIDCSGLVYNTFFMNGILLPRDADLQSLYGKVVTDRFKPDGLETGDLLFFGRRATGNQPERITHVAIYLGDSEFIHAAGYRERVSINSMDSTRTGFIPHYPEIFIRATRIIGEVDEGALSITANKYYKEIIPVKR